MEYAKDEVFQIKCNTKLNRLDIKEEGWINRLYKKMRKHKLLTMSIVAFIMFATINIIMICNFMKVLQNI